MASSKQQCRDKRLRTLSSRPLIHPAAPKRPDSFPAPPLQLQQHRHAAGCTRERGLRPGPAHALAEASFGCTGPLHQGSVEALWPGDP
eukprot:CAMPEP_0171105314 /NCGR_PEP_ID=MMETSP0766_2-20121228/62427_1 /TAXON_ID=439317 /ORGANISM="Gambierdiscus australes, Strain CAWD 149" /LENGTH=87 /DNA_ID=CAMNT_0011566133 /DNA_START=94 /DNA_END=357 /DNA_ORIENTATION=+